MSSSCSGRSLTVKWLSKTCPSFSFTVISSPSQIFTHFTSAASFFFYSFPSLFYLSPAPSVSRALPSHFLGNSCSQLPSFVKRLSFFVLHLVLSIPIIFPYRLHLIFPNIPHFASTASYSFTLSRYILPPVPSVSKELSLSFS